MNGGAVTIVYDGDGNRVAKTANGVTTQYLVDDLNPTGYPQVVEEIVGGAVARQYTYGLQRISEGQSISGSWTTSFYGYDGFGTVRQLTNSAGTITDTYDFDSFGNKINSTGTTPNNYLYRGEQYDSDLGLYYLRARYYNPLTGRFMSRDPEDGLFSIPATLHKYLYVGGDPVNAWDPTGRAEIAEYSRRLRRIGFELHHIIPLRFARFIGPLYCAIAISLPIAEHQVFTNLWRFGPLPQGVVPTTLAQIFDAAEEVYTGFPDLLQAVRACRMTVIP